MVGREDKRTSNRTVFPTLKKNVAVGYKGSGNYSLASYFGSKMELELYNECLAYQQSFLLTFQTLALCESESL